MPNAEIQAETPLTAFVVPLDALERVSGVAFFPQYVDATRRAVLDDVALDWQVHYWECVWGTLLMVMWCLGQVSKNYCTSMLNILPL